MRYIETLKDGERISEVYLCKSKSIALTKTGKEYANVMLADKTGQIDSKIWDLLFRKIAIFSFRFLQKVIQTQSFQVVY